ncbi:MAG: hypothetical protein ACR2QW_12445 [bacterium]
MNRIQLLGILSFVITVLHAYLISRNAISPIPMQFNAQGEVNWTASPGNFFRFHLIFYSLINALTLGLSFAIHQISLRWVNVPWKSYWTSSENLEKESRARLGWYLSVAAIMVNGIGILAQEMLAAKAGVKNLWLPFTLELNLFMMIALGSVALFLISLFFKFRPKR